MVVVPKRIVVAINPSASFGRNRGVGDIVAAKLSSFGHDVEPLIRGDYTSLLAASRDAVATRPDAFVVVGGDGMVNLAANVLANTGVPFGLIPAGTGNDMARALSIPFNDPDAAVDVFLEALGHPPLEIDAGLVRSDAGERWFASVLSAGFDALVNERANRLPRPRGSSRYIVALMIELARLRPIRYIVDLDGERIETDASLISVGNGVSIGGGMRVTPDAMLDDGMFDVMIVKPMGRLRFLRIFPSVFSGTHVTDPHVTIRRAARVSLASPGITAYADGERFGPLPVDIELVPGALTVFAPAP
jgi:diacylglycerol kinase (ATP)